jgi:flagellar basal-body rod protein FlgB
MKRLALITLLLLFNAAHAADPMDDFYKHLRYLSERDSLISSNIANVDTPNYVVKDLSKKKDTSGMHMNSTHPSHFDVSFGSEFEKFDSEFDEIKPNGNNVNPKRELFKKSENAAQLAEVTNSYAKARAALNLAISGGAK